MHSSSFRLRFRNGPTGNGVFRCAVHPPAMNLSRAQSVSGLAAGAEVYCRDPFLPDLQQFSSNLLPWLIEVLSYVTRAYEVEQVTLKNLNLERFCCSIPLGT